MTSPFQMSFNEWRFCWAANLNWKMIVWLWRRSISLSIKMVTSAQAQLENTVPPCPQGLCISRWLVFTDDCILLGLIARYFPSDTYQLLVYKILQSSAFEGQSLQGWLPEVRLHCGQVFYWAKYPWDSIGQLKRWSWALSKSPPIFHDWAD